MNSRLFLVLGLAAGLSLAGYVGTRAADARTTSTTPCSGDMTRFCPGVLAAEGKTANVNCLRAEDADGDAEVLTAECRASLDYMQSLNDAVLLACASWGALCPAPPELGYEVRFACWREHRAETGDACDAALDVQLAAQEQVKASSGR